jgi:membrane-associated protein
MSLGIIPDILRLIKGSDFAGVLQFLQTTGYGIMFVIMLIEGPIITYIASFAASLGIFNIYIVLVLAVFGDIIGDVVLFYIGRLSKPASIEKYEDKHLNQGRMSRLKIYLNENPGKAITVIKLTPLLPIPGLILAGTSNMKFKEFLKYSALVSFTYCLAMGLLGFYSGIAFLTIAKYVKYIEYVIGGTILLAIGIYFLIKFVSKKVSKKFGKF